MIRLFVLLVLLLWGATTYGDQSQIEEPVIVRAQIAKPTVWYGQANQYYIDVLTASGWARLSKLPDMELKGAYSLRVETQGTRLTETIQGKTYSGQRYEFLIFGVGLGKILIPSFELAIEVSSWGPEANTQFYVKDSPSISMNVEMPPGVDLSQALFTTSELSVTQHWDAPEQVHVGGAVVREIEYELGQVSAMVIPPLPLQELKNIHEYTVEGAVEDRTVRGDLTGIRRDKVTYVFEQAGHYQLPEYRFQWWNPRDQSLTWVTLEGLTVEVGSLPQSVSQNVGLQNRMLLIGLFFVMAVLAAIVWWLIRKLRLGKKVSWRSRESVLFKQLRSQVDSGNGEQVISATYLWFDHFNQVPVEFSNWLAQGNLEQFQAIWIRLNSLTSSRQAKLSDLLPEERSCFLKGLKAARKRALSKTDSRFWSKVLPVCTLPPLNFNTDD